MQKMIKTQEDLFSFSTCRSQMSPSNWVNYEIFPRLARMAGHFGIISVLYVPYSRIELYQTPNGNFIL